MQKSRWTSHLLILALVVLGLVLGWRLSPDLPWWPSLQTQPLFEQEQDIAAPVEKESADEAPQDEMSIAPEPEEVPLEESIRPVIQERAVMQAQEAEQEMETVELPDAAPPPAAPTPPLALPQDVDTLFEDWRYARRLLRQRDLAGAEAAYLALRQRWPDHPDLSGELGNVYVLMGETALARDVFEQTHQQLQVLGPSVQLRAVEAWLNQNP